MQGHFSIGMIYRCVIREMTFVFIYLRVLNWMLLSLNNYIDRTHELVFLLGEQPHLNTAYSVLGQIYNLLICISINSAYVSLMLMLGPNTPLISSLWRSDTRNIEAYYCVPIQGLKFQVFSRVRSPVSRFIIYTCPCMWIMMPFNQFASLVCHMVPLLIDTPLSNAGNRPPFHMFLMVQSSNRLAAL